MALRDGCYAKIWSAKPNKKIYSCNISVSRKDKETGEYKQEFSGFVNFSGDAAKKVAVLGLPEKSDRDNPISRSIKITRSPDISSYYNKETYKKLIDAANGNEELINFIRSRANEKYITIWDFELADSNGGSNGGDADQKPAKSAKKPAPPVDDTEVDMDDEELPF